MQEHLPIMPSTTPVDLITDQLKGQTLRLPNLFGFYSQWPNQISPHYEQLRQTIEVKIDEWIPDEHVRRKARKVDLPIFSATYVPAVSPPPCSHSTTVIISTLTNQSCKQYMAGVEGESDFVRRKEQPTLYEYWEYRQGSSSVNTFSALGEQVAMPCYST